MSKSNKVGPLLFSIPLMMCAFSPCAVARQSKTAMIEAVSPEPALDLSTTKSIRSLAKKINKKAKMMAHEFEQPVQLTGKFPNVVGPVVIQPMPPPDGIVSVGKLPPNKGMLKFIAKDIDADVTRINQLRQDLSPVEPQESTWVAWHKGISNLQQNSEELNQLLSEKDPSFFDVGTRVVAIFDLSRQIETNTRAVRFKESSQMAASKNKNL